MRHFKQERHIIITVSLLFVSLLLFSQNNKTKQVTKSNSVGQSDTIKVSGIYKAQVYFSGNGLSYVKSFNCFGSDLSLLMKMIDSASNGATVTFDYLKFINGEGVTKEIKEIPYKFNRGNDTVAFKSQAVQEVEKLKAYDFVYGTIYFAGFGFSNVSKVKASDTATLYKYYDRSGPETTITLDNCVYKNANGSLSSPISKSIKLQ